MKFSLCVLTLLCCYTNFSLSNASREYLKYGVQPLTAAQKNRIKEWTVNDKQNIWEISGQFEGDIVLSPYDTFFNGYLNKTARWRDRIIPYIIDDNGVYSEKEKRFIHKMLKEFTKHTCITARPAKKCDQDYVLIQAKEEYCFSALGRQGGAQVVNLAPKCLKNRGTILHEFLHALGFRHQHSAAERDGFVTIIEENINPESIQNFFIQGFENFTNFDVAYDYDSIMHYGEYAFSKAPCHLKTIIPKAPCAQIGQRFGFSNKDIIKLNRMYGCDPNFRSNQQDFDEK